MSAMIMNIPVRDMPSQIFKTIFVLLSMKDRTLFWSGFFSVSIADCAPENLLAADIPVVLTIHEFFRRNPIFNELVRLSPYSQCFVMILG
jgi:hypothetical protein